VNSKFAQREGHRVHHLALPPNADLHNLLGRIRHEMDLDFLVEVHLRNFDGVIE
jgi:hypothetical protein